VTEAEQGRGKAEKPHIRHPPALTIVPIADYDRTDANGTADRPVAAADILRRKLRENHEI
jgi:hypothetical protein